MIRYHSERKLAAMVLLAAIMAGVTLSAAEDGKAKRFVSFPPNKTEMTVVAQAGDTIIVKLPSRPSTGFSWRAVDVDKARFVQEEARGDQCEKRQENDEPRVGGTVFDSFQFQVMANGQSTAKEDAAIRFEHKQHFDPKAKVKRSAELVVKSR